MDYQITKYAVLPEVEMTPIQMAEAQEWIEKKIAAEWERVFPTPSPTSYPPQPVERCCYGAVLHAPNCKYWLTCT